MLIEIAKKTKGKVNDCEKVTKVSDQYRKDQDFIAQFVSLKIEKGSSSGLSKNSNGPRQVKEGSTHQTDHQWQKIEKEFAPHQIRS